MSETSKKNEKHYRFPDTLITFLNKVEKETGRSGNEVLNRIVRNYQKRYKKGLENLSDL